MEADKAGRETWRRWGPYLSERQWGTVREDYSPGGTAWEYLPHDHARSRAYRWGEDGLAGFSDDWQHVCLSLALWNGRDPILKERLFGLTNSEGNHGEDVKELYYYLDATPSHSYQKMLYKYPQGEFPYARLVEENHQRGPGQPEFGLLDTGLFDQDRYFDVFVEYAKAGPEDILMLVTVCNRGPEAARLVLLPQLCFRNTWSWYHQPARPVLAALQNRNRILIQVRALSDAGDARVGPRGVDGLQRAAEAYGPKFGEAAGEKSSYNVFTQNPWYVGKLAGAAPLPPLRRLIDNQREFTRAFEEIIRRPDAQEEVLRDMTVRCLVA